jgi:hypothetical protein
MSITIGTKLKAEMIKAVIDQITGDNAMLQERESSIKIILTEGQKEWFKKFLDAQLEMKRKPDIEIDALGIILPVVMKRIWPFLAAGGAGLAALIIEKRGNNER